MWCAGVGRWVVVECGEWRSGVGGCEESFVVARGRRGLEPSGSERDIGFECGW